jgi:hypothetical protein
MRGLIFLAVGMLFLPLQRALDRETPLATWRHRPGSVTGVTLKQSVVESLTGPSVVESHSRWPTSIWMISRR